MRLHFQAGQQGEENQDRKGGDQSGDPPDPRPDRRLASRPCKPPLGSLDSLEKPPSSTLHIPAPKFCQEMELRNGLIQLVREAACAVTLAPFFVATKCR